MEPATMLAPEAPVDTPPLSKATPSRAEQWIAGVIRGVGTALLILLLFPLVSSFLPDDGDGNAQPLGGSHLVLFLFLFVAATLPGFRSAFARRKTPDTGRYDAWVQTIMRYFLAEIAFTYGAAKIGGFQFGTNTSLWTLTHRLYEVGNGSLMWAFFDRSYPYAWCIGASQIAGGVLLLWRRTTTAGAALLSVIFVNIVLINYTYDIPVKLNSTIYLFMTLYLLAWELPRLCEVFFGVDVRRQWPSLFVVANTVARPALFLTLRWGKTAKAIVILLLAGANIGGSLWVVRTMFQKSPVYGVWRVVGTRGVSEATAPLVYFDYQGNGTYQNDFAPAPNFQKVQSRYARAFYFAYTVDEAKATITTPNALLAPVIRYTLTPVIGDTPARLRLTPFFAPTGKTPNGIFPTANEDGSLLLERLPIR